MKYVKQDLLEYIAEIFPGMPLISWHCKAINEVDAVFTNLQAQKDSMNKANSFAVCDTAPATPCPQQGWPCKSKKDVNPMNYASATLVSQEDTTLRDQRRYLLSELNDSFDKAKTALKRKFGLADDATPTSIEDAVKRIQDGLFIIPKRYLEKGASYASMAYLRWRDPKTVEDQAGYDAAKAPLKAAYTKAQRELKIFSPEKGLQSVI